MQIGIRPSARPRMSSSTPRADTQDKTHVARIYALGTYQVRGLEEASLERETDVWPELPSDLIAQAHAQLDIVQAAADRKLSYSLRRDVRLDAWLHDEPLGQEILSKERQTSGHCAVLACVSK